MYTMYINDLCIIVVKLTRWTYINWGKVSLTLSRLHLYLKMHIAAAAIYDALFPQPFTPGLHWV